MKCPYCGAETLSDTSVCQRCQAIIKERIAKKDFGLKKFRRSQLTVAD